MTERSAPQRRVDWALLSLIVIGSVALRVAFLAEPMRYDEAYTFDAYAIHSVGFITSTYTYPNNQIFSTLLTHLAFRLFGDHLWTVRFPADVAGLAIPPVAYAVARKIYDADTGLWAAGLTAASAPLVDYSVDGRGYALGVLLVLILVWLSVRLLDAEPLSWLWWFPFVGVAVMAVYTIPTMAYAVVLVAAWSGANALVTHRRSAWIFLVGLAAALLVTAGLSLALYQPVLGQPGWTFVHPLPPTWTNLSHLISSVWSNWNRSWPHPLDWLVALGFLGGLAVHARRVWLPIPLAVVAVGTLVVIAIVAPISPFVRTWLYLAPIYLITAAAGLSRGCARLSRARRATPQIGVGAGSRPRGRGLGPLPARAALVVVVGALAAGIAVRGQHGAEQPPTSDNHLVSLIRDHLRPGEQVALAGGLVYYPALYYFDRYHYVPPLFARPPDFSHRGALPARLLVIMVRPTGPRAVVAMLKAAVVAAQPWRVTLIKRMEYLDAFVVTRT